MTRFSTKLFGIASLACAGLHAADEPVKVDDLLRFTNGDQLHGTFMGMAEGPAIQWSREDVKDVVPYKVAGVRQVVLNGGRPVTSNQSLANVTLTNGDRIPGNIQSLDADSIVMDSDCAGQVKIARDRVAMIAPMPLGGKLAYFGPFARDPWAMITSDHPEGIPSEFAQAEPKSEEAEAELAEDAEAIDQAEQQAEQPALDENEIAAQKMAEDNLANLKVWQLAGASVYWNHTESGTAMVQKDVMSDRSLLRFEVGWKTRLNLAVAFQCDFFRPEEKDENGENAKQNVVRRFGAGDTSAFPYLFGNSYVIQFLSNYVVLHRVGFDENGIAFSDRIQVPNSSVQIGEIGSAVIEIRANRKSGEIALYVNGEFAMQWSEGGEVDGSEGYAAKGGGIGFIVTQDSTPTRLSDIAVAEWNGMPDSARSLQIDEHDVVLLTNGTDRFSGEVTAIKDGKVSLEGRYGAFQFPTTDIAEIRFAKERLAEFAPEKAPELTVRFHPNGRISGRPLTGTASTLRLESPLAGELELKLDSAVILEFNPNTSFLDDWDLQF